MVIGMIFCGVAIIVITYFGTYLFIGHVDGLEPIRAVLVILISYIIIAIGMLAGVMLYYL